MTAHPKWGKGEFLLINKHKKPIRCIDCSKTLRNCKPTALRCGSCANIKIALERRAKHIQEFDVKKVLGIDKEEVDSSVNYYCPACLGFTLENDKEIQLFMTHEQLNDLKEKIEKVLGITSPEDDGMFV